MTEQSRRIGVRWTVGDVSSSGFEALRLSILSLVQLLPAETQYVVCVNSLSVREAIARTGEIPSDIRWMSSNECIPSWLRNNVDPAMAEGVAWKLAPVRLFPERHEIALDNDVILWRLPEAVKQWLSSDDSNACLMAEDVQRCLGQFSDLCDERSINSGIRGLPPGFDYERCLQESLEAAGVTLSSELDEQGLQAATLGRFSLRLVSNEDVTICGAFPMHQHHLGRCGAHFVGLNQKWLPYIIDGQPAHEAIRKNWENRRTEIESRLSALK